MSNQAERRPTKKERHARHLFESAGGFRARRQDALRKGKRLLYALGALLVCLLLFGVDHSPENRTSLK